MVWDSFVLYTSQYDPIKGLTDGQLGRLLHAIYRYNLGEEVSFDDDGVLAMAFAFIRDDIDRAHANRQHISEVNSENGKKGGRPRKERAEGEKAKKAVAFFESEKSEAKRKKPNVNVNGNVNGNENGIVPPYNPPTGGSDTNKPKLVMFDPPTREDVEAYMKAKGYHFDAEEYMAFYVSNGWRVGRNPMKNWKACCTTWEKSWRKEQAKEEARRQRYEKPSEIGRIHVDMNPDKYSEGAW